VKRFLRTPSPKLEVVRTARMPDVKTGAYVQNPVIVIQDDRIRSLETAGKIRKP